MEEGYSFKLNPKEVVKAGGKGAISTFTREFPHGDLWQRGASKEARARALSDGSAFPDTAYEEHCLLWKGDKWRTPSPAQRAVIHGIPVSLISTIGAKKSEKERRRVQNCAVGNGFHVPSLAIIIVLLIQSVCSYCIPNLFETEGDRFHRQRIHGSAFDPKIFTDHESNMSQKELVNEIFEMVPLNFRDAVNWKTLKVGNSGVQKAIARLQVYKLDCKIRDSWSSTFGPEWT